MKRLIKAWLAGEKNHQPKNVGKYYLAVDKLIGLMDLKSGVATGFLA
jgi:hypothetical protein